MTYDEISDVKRTQACMCFGQYGYWYSDHFHDGRLKPHARSLNHPYNRHNPHHPEPQHNHLSSDSHDGVVMFNMGTTAGSTTDCQPSTSSTAPRSSSTVSPDLGQMVDTGAPCSSIGFADFCSLTHLTMPSWTGELDALPSQFAACRYWKYGSGSHASPARQMLAPLR